MNIQKSKQIALIEKSSIVKQLQTKTCNKAIDFISTGVGCFALTLLHSVGIYRFIGSKRLF